MTVGERIKEVRKKCGYTQKELAEKSGVATVSIQQYERGVRQPRLDQIQRIADALGVGTSYLLGGGDTISETHLANGVHIYKNTFPFKVLEPFLADPLSSSRDIAYQDECLLISVDKDAAVTPAELEKIIDAYAPFREKMADEDAEFMASVKEGEFHTQMNTAFFKLNFSGKKEAAKRVEELTEIPKYQKTPPPDGTENG